MAHQSFSMGWQHTLSGSHRSLIPRSPLEAPGSEEKASRDADLFMAMMYQGFPFNRGDGVLLLDRLVSQAWAAWLLSRTGLSMTALRQASRPFYALLE